MVKISYQPISEIVLHDVVERKPDDLFSTVIQQSVASGQVGTVPIINWVEGMVFIIGFYPDTEDIVRDKLSGKIHYAFVQFARFPEYRPEASVRVGGNDYRIRLMKSEASKTFVELARFLKNGSFGTHS